MSGLIFLAILFYAISYIAKEGKAKREAGGAARPQRSEAASAQPERPLLQGSPTPPEAAPTARQRLPDPNPTLSSAPMTGPRPSSQRSPLRRLPPAA